MTRAVRDDSNSRTLIRPSQVKGANSRRRNLSISPCGRIALRRIPTRLDFSSRCLSEHQTLIEAGLPKAIVAAIGAAAALKLIGGSRGRKASARSLGSIYFELDTGHEEDATLTRKLIRYSGSGAFQVIFIMAHRFGVKELEEKRLEKIMALGNKVLGHKPNRILANTYHGFLETGKLYNLREIEW